MALVGADGKLLQWEVKVAFEVKTGRLHIGKVEGLTNAQAHWLLQRAATQILMDPKSPPEPILDVPHPDVGGGVQ